MRTLQVGIFNIRVQSQQLLLGFHRRTGFKIEALDHTRYFRGDGDTLIWFDKADRFDGRYPVAWSRCCNRHWKIRLGHIGHVLGDLFLFEEIETNHAAEKQNRDQ